MPSWKKLITSGSDAALSSLTLTTGSLALDVRGGVTRLSGSTTVTGSVNIRSGALIVSNSLDTSAWALIASNGQTVVDWGSSLLKVNNLTPSLDWVQRVLIADDGSKVSEWSHDGITNAGRPSTYQWRRSPDYPFSVGYDLSTFDTESLEDNIITTAGKYNDTILKQTSTPVINAKSSYSNNINLIEKSYMKIDYVISDTDPITTPPSWLRVGYLEIFSDRINSPTLAYSSSIKTEFGTVPDILYDHTETSTNWTAGTATQIYFINNTGDEQFIRIKYNIWAM